MLVVRVQVKEILKEAGLGVDNISSDYLERLDDEVKGLILRSVNRAKENNRRTVMARDL